MAYSRIPLTPGAPAPTPTGPAAPRPSDQYGEVTKNGRRVITINGRLSHYADTGQPYEERDWLDRVNQIAPYVFGGLTGASALGLLGGGSSAGTAAGGAARTAGTAAANATSATGSLLSRLVQAAAPIATTLLASRGMNNATTNPATDPSLAPLIPALQQLFQTQIAQSNLQAQRAQMSQPLFEQVLRQITGSLPTWTQR